LPLMKNVGVPETSLRSAESTSAAILACPAWVRRPAVNCSVSRAELASVADQVADGQRVLVAEQLVVHLPEPALAGRGLGGLGGEQGMRGARR